LGRKTRHGRRKTGCDGTYCLEALRRSNGFSLTQVTDELEGCPSVLAAPLDSHEAARLAACFSALDVPVRQRILSALAAPPKAKSVCSSIEPIGKSQGAISHHPKILGVAGPVHGDRRGKWVWYSLDRERLATLRVALDCQPRAELHLRRADLRACLSGSQVAGGGDSLVGERVGAGVSAFCEDCET
jgi:ArsR family transcriptional regulator, arsenate/arsenite/antimonite-responsive transcriptional repressor